MELNEQAQNVKKASIILSSTSTEERNNALRKIAEELARRSDEIINANNIDIERSKQENLADPIIKRLRFDINKINNVIDGINSLINLPDPIGKTLMATQLDEGLELFKISCPIGVIGIIFESRPDALVQISTLCLKSGNGVLLKGGSEARETNRILYEIIKNATSKVGIPNNWIMLLESREEVSAMLKLDKYIDLIIPRGSNSFVKYIMNNSSIPVMGHADGICHCYVDYYADIDMAIKVVVDSKTQYVSVCNALETLLVNEKIATKFLPRLKTILEKNNVKILGCAKTQSIIDVLPANDTDWETEYLDYVISIKVVSDIEEAINHINTFGSGHTDSIITSSKDNADKFMNLVDSGNVFWNCSTRFSDGFRYGFGAEVGVSTGKIHARGPVGLEGLTIYKYKLIGNGNIVADYENKLKKYTHKTINKSYND